MSSRIRYASTSEPNTVESVRLFNVNGTNYRVRYNKVMLNYVILDVDNSDCPVSSGTANNELTLKRHVKRALENLGFQFAKETRKGSEPTL